MLDPSTSCQFSQHPVQVPPALSPHLVSSTAQETGWTLPARFSLLYLRLHRHHHQFLQIRIRSWKLLFVQKHHVSASVASLLDVSVASLLVMSVASPRVIVIVAIVASEASPRLAIVVSEASPRLVIVASEASPLLVEARSEASPPRRNPNALVATPARVHPQGQVRPAPALHPHRPGLPEAPSLPSRSPSRSPRPRASRRSRGIKHRPLFRFATFYSSF